MIRLVLRPAARQDIADIWLYTADLWGADQADNDVSNFDREIAQALAFPAIGSPVEGQSNDYRKLASGKHRIIYRHNDHELIVVRIIHERQDIPLDLEEFIFHHAGLPASAIPYSSARLRTGSIDNLLYHKV